MDIIEGVRVAMKEMMLPELDRIREDNKEIKATLFMINKRLDDVNLHLADQSRRIDAVREEMSGRIDLLSVRIDSLSENLGGRIDAVSKELGGRIDAAREEMSGRIDLLSVRIDSLHENLGGRIDSMAQKFDTRMDRLYEVIVRRDEHALAERRIATLEKDVADIRLRLAA